MGKLSLIAKSRVYANLEKYARSGMGMEKACESMLSQPGVKTAEREIYQGLLKGLNQGMTIGDALSHNDVVSNLEVEVVSASERGGMLEKGFAHLALYFRRMDRTRSKIVKGLTYPIVLIHLAVPVTIFASTMFSRLQPDAEVMTLGESIGDAGKQVVVWMLVLYAVALVLLFFGWVTWKSARNSAGIDSFLNSLPLIGKARRFISLERFCRVFEIFLLSGLKMSDSLEGSGKASGSGVLQDASEKGGRTVADGHPLSEAIFGFPRVYPNDFARGVAAAEESGMLDSEMHQWGEFYGDSAAESMDKLAEWAPKLFYWFVLFFVAFMIVRAGIAYSQALNSWINF